MSTKFTTKKAVILSAILLLAAAAVGIWLSQNGSLDGGEESKEYKPKFSNPQTFESQNPAQKNDFVFQYPEKFNVVREPIEGGGEKILVESQDPKKGFEVTVLPFDEQGPLTAARVKQDLPNIVMDNQKSVTVGAEKIPALAFNSTDENIGKTFEIWFIYSGSLYQALTYPEFAGGMEEILKTWKFK